MYIFQGGGWKNIHKMGKNTKKNEINTKIFDVNKNTVAKLFVDRFCETTKKIELESRTAPS
jgi:hypothetical protein